MKKYRVQIEAKLPDSIEPCVYGCEMWCPFGKLRLMRMPTKYTCFERHWQDGELVCPVKLGRRIDG